MRWCPTTTAWSPDTPGAFDTSVMPALTRAPRALGGGVQVETKSLDGETNLKGRSVPKVFLNLLGATPAQQVRELSRLKGHVECENPNAATTKFTGKVIIDGQPTVALSISNVLLRSSSVRNTDYVIGLVVNTGKDSKVMQGQQPPKTKRSSLDIGINYLMMGIIFSQFVLCIICTVLNQIWDDQLQHPAWYLHEGAEIIPLPNLCAREWGSPPRATPAPRRQPAQRAEPAAEERS